MRFDVFKRDKFKCQYCGAEAPNVILHADHIKPVAEGGETTLLNLVTACIGCNLGKGARPLDDDSAVTKQRTQIEDLQERREQLEMMLAWHDGLMDIEGDAIKAACERWAKYAPGWLVSETGKKRIRAWIKKFGLPGVVSAMQDAADNYVVLDKDGNATAESWAEAFGKIGGIAKYDQIRRDDPVGAELLHIRNVVAKRTRIYGAMLSELHTALRDAHARGASTQDLWRATSGLSGYSQVRDWISANVGVE